jgi:cyclic pyranopterin phosphate synthase
LKSKKNPKSAKAKKSRIPSGPRKAALTHIDETGRPQMVNVGAKPLTERIARAEGWLKTSGQTLHELEQGRTPKGDPLVVAQIAGIQAAKRTAELIPLCHPLALTHIEVTVEPDASAPGIKVTASARVAGPTGVEMEALTATAVALLTLYDMLKAVDRGMTIEGVRLLEKRGGRSGDWSATPTSSGG